MKKLTYEEKEHLEGLIFRCKYLTDVINSTIDLSDFFYAMNELCNILIHLSSYEKYGIFTSTPSKDYKNIKNNIGQTEIELLNRIREDCACPNDFFNKVEPFYESFSSSAQTKIRKLKEYYYPTILYVEKHKSLFSSFMDMLKLEKDNTQYGIYISDISNLPRYYIIRGKKYDIDSIKSVSQLPTDIYSTFIFENIEYGIDTVLRIQASACYKVGNEKLCRICVDKSNEFFNQGIYFETDEEKQERIKRESKEKEELLLRKEQLQKTTIDVMLHFQDSFKYQLNCSILKRYNMAFILLNKNNQFVALTDISAINELVKQSIMLSKYIPEDIVLCTEDICFTYKKSQSGTGYMDEPPYTYLEYIPFTRTYKYRKYPIKLHFSYENHNCYSDFTKDSAWGELEYCQDGTIGKGKLIRWINSYLFKYYFKSIGRSLVISKIESNITCNISGTVDTIYKF